MRYIKLIAYFRKIKKNRTHATKTNGFVLTNGFLKHCIIKKKVKIAKKKIVEQLHRDPNYVHPKLKFLPNIVINLVSFLLSLLVVATLLYFVLSYLIRKFYHFN